MQRHTLARMLGVVGMVLMVATGIITIGGLLVVLTIATIQGDRSAPIALAIAAPLFLGLGLIILSDRLKSGEW